jgi:hypothetical protein
MCIQPMNFLPFFFVFSWPFEATFSFRPHSGEAGKEYRCAIENKKFFTGDIDHLASTFLVAQAINHGINLEKNTTLQYL